MSAEDIFEFESKYTDIILIVKLQNHMLRQSTDRWLAQNIPCPN
jgi:hypothetical protein